MLQPPVVALSATTFFGHHLDYFPDAGVQQPRRRCQGQLVAAMESPSLKMPDRVWDRDASQRRTALEGTTPYVRH